MKREGVTATGGTTDDAGVNDIPGIPSPKSRFLLLLPLHFLGFRLRTLLRLLGLPQNTNRKVLSTLPPSPIPSVLEAIRTRSVKHSGSRKRFRSLGREVRAHPCGIEERREG
jgi:hypothetical protein